MYKMTVYKVWDGKMLRTEKSNNLEYFNRYKHKINYRIAITKGNKVIYDER